MRSANQSSQMKNIYVNVENDDTFDSSFGFYRYLCLVYVCVDVSFLRFSTLGVKLFTLQNGSHGDIVRTHTKKNQLFFDSVMQDILRNSNLKIMCLSFLKFILFIVVATF